MITEKELVVLDDILIKTRKRRKTLEQLDSAIVNKLCLDSALEHEIYNHYARFKRLIYNINYQEEEGNFVEALLIIRYDFSNDVLQENLKGLSNNLTNAKIENIYYDIIYNYDNSEVNPLNFRCDIIDKDIDIQRFLNSDNVDEESRLEAIKEYFNYEYKASNKM